MTIKQISYKEFLYLVDSQGHKDRFDATFQCPACKTLQSGNDLVRATGLSREEVQKWLGYSCIGRFNEEVKGCDWTLGGLLQIHELEVLTDDGNVHPHFVPMSLEDLQDE